MTIKKHRRCFGGPDNDPAERIAAFEGMVQGGANSLQEQADDLCELNGQLE